MIHDSGGSCSQIKQVFKAFPHDMVGGKGCGAGEGACCTFRESFRHDDHFRSTSFLDCLVEEKGLTISTVTEMEDADGLRELLEHVFDQVRSGTWPTTTQLPYLFHPERHLVKYGGLTFELLLNAGRADYVAQITRPMRNATHKSTSGSSTAERKQPDGGEAVPSKQSVLPHTPPPGDLICPFDSLERSPHLVQAVRYAGLDYLIVVNLWPWGFNHFMLVTPQPEPQQLTEHHLRAGVELLRKLGPEYEGIFNGVRAGASVYHFHFQYHKGTVALWANLDCGHIIRQILSTRDCTVSRLLGWPAEVFLFEGTDFAEVCRAVTEQVKALSAGDNDVPYNLTFRCAGDRVQCLLILRSLKGEKPTKLNTQSNSWGRFGLLEMAGSVLLLTRPGFEEMVADPSTGERIFTAIAEMSVDPHRANRLLDSSFGYRN